MSLCFNTKLSTLNSQLRKTHLAVLNGEEFVVSLFASEYAVQVVAIGIRHEGLSKTVAADQFYNLLHTAGVQLVEDVIQQEDGCGLLPGVVKEVELCQFQGDEVRLILSLTTLSLEWETAERHLKVVLVNAM